MITFTSKALFLMIVKTTLSPPADEWINHWGYTHTVEYYSTVKGMNYMTRMNLENIVLSEIS